MFYIYIWFNLENNEVFYVGKGSRARYKQIAHRNRLFNKYIKEHQCSSKIIKYIDKEDDAYKEEIKYIAYYRSIGQAKCNIEKGGTGGDTSIWDDYKRKYWSKYNPMKEESQRERMRINNPMKRKEIATKTNSQKIKSLFIDNVYYSSPKEASIKNNVCLETIYVWCKRGYNTEGKPCHYKNEKQKNYIFKKSSAKTIIIDNIKFTSVTEGARFLNTTADNLIHYLKKNKPYKGHKCSYDNQQPSISLND